MGARHSLRRAISLSASAVLVGGGIALAVAPPAQAVGTTRYVATTGSDTENDCSDQAQPCRTIQHAVDVAQAAADGNETVSVAAGTYAEQVEITSTIAISGAGTSGTTDTKITGNADGGPSIIVHTPGETQTTATLQHLDISGNTQNDDGIDVDNANLDISDSAVSNNSGDGIYVQGTGSPTVTITGATISGNNYAGVYIDSGEVAPTPRVTITGSTITGNGTDSEGEGAYDDDSGIEQYAGTLDLSNSIVSRNVFHGLWASGDGVTATVGDTTFEANGGAGVMIDSGAAVTVGDSTVSNSIPMTEQERYDQTSIGSGVAVQYGSTLTMHDSTVAGNTGYGVFEADGTATIENSTVSGTQKPTQSLGVLGAAAVVSASLDKTTLTGTVVAQNSVPDCAGYPEGTVITDGGYNLDDDGTCGFTAAQHSVSKGMSKLGALANNGGPTQTLLPAKGSQLIDAIPTGSAGCSASGTDQRGLPRLAGPKCDIGAVEVAQPPVVITPASLPSGTVGLAYSAQLSATGGLGAPYAFSLAAGSSLPGGLSLSSAGAISGTPTAAGTFSVTVSVDDPTLRTYTIVISAAAAAPLAATGADSATALAWGLGLLGAGLLLVAAGAIRRRSAPGVA